MTDGEPKRVNICDDDIVKVRIRFYDDLIGKAYYDYGDFIRLSNGKGIYLESGDKIIRINHIDDIKQYALEVLKRD